MADSSSNWWNNYSSQSQPSSLQQNDGSWWSQYKTDPNQPDVVEQQPKQQISTAEDIKKQQPTIAAQTLAGAAMFLPNTLDFGAQMGVQAANALTGNNAQWPGVMNIPGEVYSMVTGKSNPLPNMPSTSGELLSRIGEDTGTKEYIAREPETTGGNLANLGEQFAGMGALGGTKLAETANGTLLNGLKTIPSSLGAATGTEISNQLGFGPIGQFVGGYLGGETPSSAMSGLTKIKSPIGPITDAGQKQAAIQNVMANSDNPQVLAQQAQVSAANQNPSGETSSIAPQINLTAAEMVPDDQKLVNYQAQTLKEAKKTGNPVFVERVQAMNDARTEAVNQFMNAIKENGDTESPGQLFTSHLNAINEQQRAAEAGQNAIVSRLSPNQSLDDVGVQATESYEQARNEAENQRDNAYASLEPLRPQIVSIGDIRDKAVELSRNASVRLNKPTDIEQNAYDYAQQLPNANISFGNLLDFHKDINDTISQIGRQQGFKSEPVSRLYQLKNSVESAINNAIDQNKDPVHQTIRDWLTDLYSNHSEGQISNEQSVTARNGQAESPVTSTEIYRSPNETEGNQGSQSGSNEVSGTVSPGEQFKIARQSNVNLKSTFDNPKILSTTFAKQGGEYTKSEATRGAQLFKSGTEGGKNIDDLIAANVPKNLIEDSALNKLRNDNIIRGDDGDINRLQKWQFQHDSALSRLPELKQKLNDVSVTSQTLIEQAQKAKDEQKLLNSSSASEFLNKENPTKAIEKTIKNGVESATELINRIGDNQTAKDGIKAAVVEHLQNKFGDEPKQAEKMFDYLQQNKQALTRLLGGEKTFNDIVRVAKLKMSDAESGPSSLGKLETKSVKKQSIFGKLHSMFGEAGEVVAGGAAAHFLPHVPVAAAVIGGLALISRSIKNAGYKNIKQFEQDIMLNPGAYPELFQKYAKDQDIPISTAKKLSQRIISNASAISAYQSQKDKK